MRTENGDLIVPEFEPNIPEHLIHQCSPKERWVYEQMSIHGQQNQWLIARSVKADKRQKETEEDFHVLKQQVEALRDFKAKLTAKWTVLAAIGTLLVLPVTVGIMIEWALVKLKIK